MILRSGSDHTLQNIIKGIVLHEWDPIGVGNIPEADDEYDAYVLDLCALVLQESSVEEIFSYLRQLETEHIGLEGDEKRTLEIAQRIHHIAAQRPLA